MKTLFLFRHMKSSWNEDGVPDHDRPLAPRGRRALATMADYLRHRKGATPTPELILCSSARRTRETLAGLTLPRGAGGGIWDTPPPVRVEEALYMADAAALLARLRALGGRGPGGGDETGSTGGAPGTVMLIGHNPGLEDLALDLVSPRAPADTSALPPEEKEALDRLTMKYPTGGLALLDLAIDDWPALRPGLGRLRAFITPRMLTSG